MHCQPSFPLESIYVFMYENLKIYMYIHIIYYIIYLYVLIYAQSFIYYDTFFISSRSIYSSQSHPLEYEVTPTSPYWSDDSPVYFWLPIITIYFVNKY